MLPRCPECGRRLTELASGEIVCDGCSRRFPVDVARPAEPKVTGQLEIMDATAECSKRSAEAGGPESATMLPGEGRASTGEPASASLVRFPGSADRESVPSLEEAKRLIVRVLTRLTTGAVPEVIARMYNITSGSLWFGVDDTACQVPSDSIEVGVDVQHLTATGADGITLAYPMIEPTAAGQRELDHIYRRQPNALVVGDRLQAIAYPGQVLMPVPMRSVTLPEGIDLVHRTDCFVTFRPPSSEDGS